MSPNFHYFQFFIFIIFLFFTNLKEIFLIIALNILLSLPAIIYLFSLENIFLFRTAVPSDKISSEDFLIFRIKFLLLVQLFFYALPFIFTQSIKIDFKKINF